MDKYYDDSTKMSNLSKETKDLLKECESCIAWSGSDCIRNPITEGCLKEKFQSYEMVNHP